MESLEQEALKIQHPYFPRDAPLDHYVPSQFNVGEAFMTLGSAIAVLMVTSAVLIKRSSKQLTCKDKSIVVWMMVCAGIHIVLEGYFSFNHKNLAGMQTVMADLWREYAHSDSRYLTSDPFTVIMEGITAICDGSFAAVTAYGVLVDSPIRYPAQLVTSLMQLYGNILYMGINCMEGFRYTNPHPYYFYGYFVLMNAFWIVIPICLIVDAVKNLYRGMLIAQRAAIVKKAN
ncbi:hypothetical protein LPJ78_002393 [Coemansia sp. RSA 989]|nr:Emopamil binding protein-domain-containing protein [Coemansia mojavensis]KAJ1742414.1 hypothetical protein LPJ68_001923 [Coemansia sp. RSA 1086]KAJ1752777.1 hypothetical protein LPJ79_000913 [Coemansia sp. RSA 1821]KAJ1865800.1 hypothetical protein LPJ78_002393 [Coemansia sp. RSA 989]KAJ1875189.1 hypothetical protein LPJ55_000861 [Coemansia sp. RSA 990]KAJ2631287.1 hypothetical protein H4R22_002093 [Coemansia sp. RSA 1290]KAJ2650587.1 hypothetical protein IWW40_002324 [Coemansia sp. RSA 12